MQKRYRTLRLLGAIALTVVAAGCATYDGDVPVELDAPERVYISPANQDGIQDELRLQLEIPAVANLIVQGYRFAVLDGEGTEIYVEAAEVPLRPRRAVVDLPRQLVWTGVTSDGENVADGEYTYSVEAWDRKGNRGQTAPLYVVVDNTPPSVEVYAPFPLFSPNGDGRLDELQILQVNSTSEDEWTGDILGAGGRSVRSYTWQGAAPDFSWDGKNSEGVVTPDGEYGYRVSSTDRAGNSSSAELSGISVDTEPTPVALDLSSSAFSPNGDGVRDVLTLMPRLSVTRNIESWSLDIYNELGSLSLSLQGTSPVPQSVTFDGRDQSGSLYPDGDYRGLLSVTYLNGDTPQAASAVFSLDTVEPVGALSAAYTVFSPNGDGRKDTVEIWQSSSAEQSWQGSILDSARRTVRSYAWEGRVAPVVWDARDNAGAIVADGNYHYQLTATDAAGNSTLVSLASIVVDTRSTPVSVAWTARSFSPNGDGIMENVGFNVTASFPENMVAWTLDVLTGSGTSVRTIGGSGRIPQRVTWDGRDQDGGMTEGWYAASVAIEYLNGNVGSASSQAGTVLDITSPILTVSSAPTPFSPDNDGFDDLMTISLAAADATAIEEWSAVITDPAGNPFRTYSGIGALPRQLTWNGLSDDGELAQSAEDYLITVTARDSVWNTGSAGHTLPVDILVLREGDRLRIVISSIYFKPFTADYLSIAPEDAERNLRTLDRLAEILTKYGQYQIRLEGHAVRVYWNDPQRLQTEEREVLLPLSTQRAEVIRQALIERGIAASRMTTEGFGGTQPVVPHGDLENRWKNRRVEFLLIRAN